MSTVRWHVTMSLDGFIAGAGDSMAWAFDYDDRSPWVDELIAATGAILAGRRWHDVATERYDGRRGIYGGAWDGPVMVLTHRPTPPPEDTGISFVTDGIRDAVAATRAAAGGKDIGVFGADVARQCLAAGLLEEIVVHVAPVLLGDGVRFFDAPGGEPVRLERTDARTSGQLTDLRFRVT